MAWAGLFSTGLQPCRTSAFNKFPEINTIEIHLATNFQNKTLDSKLFPKDLYAKMVEWTKVNCQSDRLSEEAMRGTNRYIGSPVERIEDLRFLRGRGEFVGDLRREGMLHAAILRSPIAHGRIRGLDASAALTMPGVRAVITAAQIGAGADNPAAPLAAARHRAVPSAGHRGRPRALCRGAGRGRPGRQRGSGRGRGRGDRLGDRRIAAGRRSPRVGEARYPAVRGERHQSRDEFHRDDRRCRRGVSRGRLRQARAVQGPALHRDADGAARSPRRMGCGARRE